MLSAEDSIDARCATYERRGSEITAAPAAGPQMAKNLFIATQMESGANCAEQMWELDSRMSRLGSAGIPFRQQPGWAQR